MEKTVLVPMADGSEELSNTLFYHLTHRCVLFNSSLPSATGTKTVFAIPSSSSH